MTVCQPKYITDITSRFVIISSVVTGKSNICGSAWKAALSFLEECQECIFLKVQSNLSGLRGENFHSEQQKKFFSYNKENNLFSKL